MRDELLNGEIFYTLEEVDRCTLAGRTSQFWPRLTGRQNDCRRSLVPRSSIGLNSGLT